MQIGEYTNAAGQVFHGDIPRYMAGDPTAGKLSGGFLFKMYGLPAAAIAIWHSAKPENRAKVGGIMISAALTSFLTGITEPIEFSFMFVAPILYAIHAILAGLAFPICILLGMRDGTSFSHGLIDFVVLSGNSSKIWLFPLVGIIYGVVYYTIFRVLIAKLNLKTPAVKSRLTSRRSVQPVTWLPAWSSHLAARTTSPTWMPVSHVCASAWQTWRKWTRRVLSSSALPALWLLVPAFRLSSVLNPIT